MSSTKIVAVIPARMGSTRFPGKPIKKILNLPMIEHVRRRALLCNVLDEVFVATCDQEIMEVVSNFGGKAIMTSDRHERCTDRVEEAMQSIEADIVVILQGDEPLFVPDVIDKLILPIRRNKELGCTNLLSIIQEEADLTDDDIIKATVDQENYVMYFSRSPIPYKRVNRDCSLYRQTGISAFTKSFLHHFSELKPTPLEITESIDFLRILEHRFPIQGVIYDQGTVGVDQADDIGIVEVILEEDSLQNEIYQKILKI